MSTQVITIFIIALAGFAVALILAMRHLWQQRQQLKLQSETIRQLQISQREKLEVVETTLNPHLFKNVLNSIQSHAYQTYFALDKLANVLDYILYDSRQPFVAPKEEIAFMLNLVEINKIKLSPLFELQIKTTLDEQDKYYSEKLIAPRDATDRIKNRVQVARRGFYSTLRETTRALQEATRAKWKDLL